VLAENESSAFTASCAWGGLERFGGGVYCGKLTWCCSGDWICAMEERDCLRWSEGESSACWRCCSWSCCCCCCFASGLSSEERLNDMIGGAAVSAFLDVAAGLGFGEGDSDTWLLDGDYAVLLLYWPRSRHLSTEQNATTPPRAQRCDISDPASRVPLCSSSLLTLHLGSPI